MAWRSPLPDPTRSGTPVQVGRAGADAPYYFGYAAEPNPSTAALLANPFKGIGSFAGKLLYAKLSGPATFQVRKSALSAGQQVWQAIKPATAPVVGVSVPALTSGAAMTMDAAIGGPLGGIAAPASGPKWQILVKSDGPYFAPVTFDVPQSGAIVNVPMTMVAVTGAHTVKFEWSARAAGNPSAAFVPFATSTFRIYAMPGFSANPWPAGKTASANDSLCVPEILLEFASRIKFNKLDPASVASSVADFLRTGALPLRYKPQWEVGNGDATDWQTPYVTTFPAGQVASLPGLPVVIDPPSLIHLPTILSRIPAGAEQEWIDVGSIDCAAILITVANAVGARLHMRTISGFGGLTTDIGYLNGVKVAYTPLAINPVVPVGWAGWWPPASVATNAVAPPVGPAPKNKVPFHAFATDETGGLVWDLAFAVNGAASTEDPNVASTANYQPVAVEAIPYSSPMAYDYLDALVDAKSLTGGAKGMPVDVDVTALALEP